MARSPSPAETLLKEVIAQAVTPPLKAAKFRKTGMNYHRRLGETVQVVNVQVSHGSDWSRKTFYVNVGIAFDAFYGLLGRPVAERPKEYECDRWGVRYRLEELVSGAPDQWDVRHDADTGPTVESLRGIMDRLVAELDRIDGLAAYRSHPWFDRDPASEVIARILYLSGDHDGAWREVQDLAASLVGHEYGERPDWWIEHLGLSAQKSRLT
jgi:hypothetical protein